MEYGWIDLGNGRQVFRRLGGTVELARSSLPAPMLSLDAMAPVQSMLDGKLYDSKSQLRSTYKQAGMIEVGNDPARHRPREKPKVDRKAIKDTLDRATARYERGERT